MLVPMENVQTLLGEFWLPDAPENKVLGRLQWVKNGYKLRTDDDLAPSNRLRTTRQSPFGSVMEAGGPASVVRDFVARLVVGRLADGVFVSMLDARMSSEWEGQEFSGYQILRGDNSVRTLDQTCSAVRWRCTKLELPQWPTDQPAKFGSATVAGWDGGPGGLHVCFGEPVSMRVASELVPAYVECLLTLWSGVSPNRSKVEVQLAGSDAWLTYGNYELPSEPRPWSRFLPTNAATLPVLAKWLNLQQSLGPLPFAVASADTTLQRDAHTLAATLEGLHRRLHHERPGSRLPGASRNAQDRARSAAAKAAAKCLEGQVNQLSVEDIETRYRNLLSHAGDATYKERLQDIVDAVCPIAPELFRPDKDTWINDVTKLRNEESHKDLVLNDFGEAEMSKYHALKTSMRWILTFRLLREVCDPVMLRDGHVDSERYLYVLANLERDQPLPDLRQAGQDDLLSKLLLKLCPFLPKITEENDRFTITIPGLQISADGTTEDAALRTALDELRKYANSAIEEPDHPKASHDNTAFAQFVALSTDDQLISWLKRE